jgi:Carboxypeptidase regulatory-like domain
VFGRLGVGAILAFACALALPGLAFAANGSISGTVTNTSHFGIEGVEVCAWGFEPTEDEGCDVTSSTGDYSIAGLTPGEYAVEFWPLTVNYVPQWYNGKSFAEMPDGVTVSSGADTPGIDAELMPGGEIKGRVVSDAPANPPLKGIPVIAFNLTGEEVLEAETNANGEYSIDRVSPGTYKVEFFDFAGNYVTQYWNEESFWEEADTFTVAAEGVKTGIDAEMKRAGFISGRLSDSLSGVPLNHIEVCAQNPVNAEFISCADSGPTGEYRLGRLPEGPSKVVFVPEFFAEGEESPSGYETQYYNGKATFAAADPINVVEAGLVPNIDARLVNLHPPKIPTATPLLPSPLLPAPPHPRHTLKCKKGFHKKKVKGKQRCMKAHGKRHHRHTRRH